MEDEETKGDEGDYEDLQVIDLAKEVAKGQEVLLKYQIITHRYHELIPHMSKLLKTKAPAPTIKYLLMSNLLTVVFLYRLHNGEVLGDGIHEVLVDILLKQLLSKEAQSLVTDVESSYYFFLKTLVTHDSSFLSLLKLYEPMILEDLDAITKSKVDLVECFLREFDLLHHSEQAL